MAEVAAPGGRLRAQGRRERDGSGDAGSAREDGTTGDLTLRGAHDVPQRPARRYVIGNDRNCRDLFTRRSPGRTYPRSTETLKASFTFSFFEEPWQEYGPPLKQE